MGAFLKLKPKYELQYTLAQYTNWNRIATYFLSFEFGSKKRRS